MCNLWTDDRDHSAGNAEWKQKYTGIKIFGGAFDAVPSATEYVQCRPICVCTHLSH